MAVAGLPAAATANTHTTSQPYISDPPNVIGRGKQLLASCNLLVVFYVTFNMPEFKIKSWKDPEAVPAPVRRKLGGT